MVEQPIFTETINIKKPQYKEDKVHSRVLTISRATRPWQVGIRFAIFFFFQFTLFLRSSPNVYSFLASLSVSLHFLFLCFSDIGFLCLLLVGWSIMNVTIPLLLVFISSRFLVCGSVVPLSISLPRETRDSRESGQRVAVRNLHIPFFRQDALGGVETATNRPIKCYTTITMTLNLLY